MASSQKGRCPGGQGCCSGAQHDGNCLFDRLFPSSCLGCQSPPKLCLGTSLERKTLEPALVPSFLFLQVDAAPAARSLGDQSGNFDSGAGCQGPLRRVPGHATPLPSPPAPGKSRFPFFPLYSSLIFLPGSRHCASRSGSGLSGATGCFIISRRAACQEHKTVKINQIRAAMASSWNNLNIWIITDGRRCRRFIKAVSRKVPGIRESGKH